MSPLFKFFLFLLVGTLNPISVAGQFTNCTKKDDCTMNDYCPTYARSDDPSQTYQFTSCVNGTCRCFSPYRGGSGVPPRSRSTSACSLKIDSRSCDLACRKYSSYVTASQRAYTCVGDSRCWCEARPCPTLSRCLGYGETGLCQCGGTNICPATTCSPYGFGTCMCDDKTAPMKRRCFPDDYCKGVCRAQYYQFGYFCVGKCFCSNLAWA